MDNSTANPKQQLLDRLKSSTNILVTVSANPSVDQLAACLGLTLWLNKQGKHATAVFSGNVPSTLEFLQPEETLEKTTDSLRDFIIALDKSKADKLRYKVEDRVVKIFITPYRTNLSANDLEFSQGDFNVDMVVAIGVTAQEDLDVAITAHGRILHDATVTTVTTSPDSQLGSINWNDASASSLCELVVDLGNELDRTLLDGQIATALLTGIVAETERFSNQKTTPQTMNVSAELMSAGANQQLVASKLEEPVTTAVPPTTPSEDDHPEGDQPTPPADGGDQPKPPKNEDGTLEIEHPAEEPESEAPTDDSATPDVPVTSEPNAAADEPADAPQKDTTVTTNDAEPADEPTTEEGIGDTGPKLITEPPTLGGTLTANSRPDDDAPDPVTDPLSLPSVETDQPLLEHDSQVTQPAVADDQPGLPLQPPPADWMPPTVDQPAAPAMPWLNPTPAAAPDDVSPAVPDLPPLPFQDDTASETLSEIEKAVDSPHLTDQVDSARDEVSRALNAVPDSNPEPVQALNAQTIDLTSTPPPMPDQPVPVLPPAAPAVNMAFDPSAFEVANDPDLPAAPAVPLNPDPVLPLAAPPTAEEVTGLPNQLPAMPLPPVKSSAPLMPTPASTPAILDPTAPPPVPPPLMPPNFPPAA